MADYRDVAPELGTLADFDAMVAAAHRAGIKVIVDIVPNHTSDLHPWFQEALAAEPGSAARARYIFRDGTGPDGAQPPSDWVSHFGGPAWTRLPDGQWYCHLFAPEQPDLNWDNREVRDDFLAHPAVLGRPRRRRLPGRRGARAGQGPVRAAAQQDDRAARGARRHRPAVRPQRGARDLRGVAARCSTPTTRRGPRWPRPSPRRPPAARCYAQPTGLGQAFNFDLLKADFDAAAYREVVTDSLDQALLAGSSSTWVLSNHDVVRHTSRFGLPDGADYAQWLMSDGRDAGARRGQGPAPGPRGDAVHAGPARLGLPLPGRGAGPARGGRPAGRRAAGPDLAAHRQHR